MALGKCSLLLFQELLNKGEGVATVADGVLGFKSHLRKGLLKAIRLENRVPAKRVVASGLYNASLAAACKHNGLSIRTLTEGKDALGVCCLVLEVLYHLPETFTADAFQEVLAAGGWGSGQEFNTYM